MENGFGKIAGMTRSIYNCCKYGFVMNILSRLNRSNNLGEGNGGGEREISLAL